MKACNHLFRMGRPGEMNRQVGRLFALENGGGVSSGGVDSVRIKSALQHMQRPYIVRVAASGYVSSRLPIRRGRAEVPFLKWVGQLVLSAGKI
jgi:hypothetical protein